MHVSAAAKIYFFKWVQPAVRHRLTYIKMFVLTSSGDILGKKHAFWPKMQKIGITLQNSRDPSMGNNNAWLTFYPLAILHQILNNSVDYTRELFWLILAIWVMYVTKHHCLWQTVIDHCTVKGPKYIVDIFLSSPENGYETWRYICAVDVTI